MSQKGVRVGRVLAVCSLNIPTDAYALLYKPYFFVTTCWYKVMVLPQGYPAFPFEMYSFLIPVENMSWVIPVTQEIRQVAVIRSVSVDWEYIGDDKSYPVIIIGIMISQHKKPYSQTSIMECHKGFWLLLTVQQLQCQYSSYCRGFCFPLL